MNDKLYTIPKSLQNDERVCKSTATAALEAGKVIFFPEESFSFTKDEQHLLMPNVLEKGRKNISYDFQKEALAGIAKTLESAEAMQQMMHRFALFARQLVDHTMPHYSAYLHWGRTSYRPAEIDGRKTSKRKDDTRLHVDAFPATPVNGQRILRVFCNINPDAKPRVWHVGEPFSEVLNRFLPNIAPYRTIVAQWLKFIKSTKTLRSAYDHYMLKLHDTMKLDQEYQNNVTKERIDFPANTTWIVFTDHVSHAALSGQFLLEQTFYLPVEHMLNPDLSPLKQWEAVRVLQ